MFFFCGGGRGGGGGVLLVCFPDTSYKRNCVKNKGINVFNF